MDQKREEGYKNRVKKKREKEAEMVTVEINKTIVTMPWEEFCSLYGTCRIPSGCNVIDYPLKAV